MRHELRRAALVVPYCVPQVAQTRRSSRENRTSSVATVVAVLEVAIVNAQRRGNSRNSVISSNMIIGHAHVYVYVYVYIRSW